MKKISLFEVVLCFECKWSGSLINTKREEIGSDVVKYGYLCPSCGLPLAHERSNGEIDLLLENAVVVPPQHRA